MRLLDLEPEFMQIIEPGRTYQRIDDLASAHGVLFLCPKCFAANSGSVGTHSVLCWFSGRGVLDSETPAPGRWEPIGTGFVRHGEILDIP